MTLVFAGCSSPKVDKQSGILINDTAPDSALISYNELIGKGRYEAAWSLLTKSSQKQVKANDIKSQVEVTKMQTAKLAKVFKPEIMAKMALVGYIRTNSFEGKESAIVGLSIVKKEQNNWRLVKGDGDIPKDKVKDLLTGALKLEKKMVADKLDGFNQFQRDQIKSQLNAIISSQEAQLAALEKQPAQVEAQGGQPKAGQKEDHSTESKTESKPAPEKTKN